MKVVFVTLGNERTPSSRYRVFQYLSELKHAGWESTVVVPRRGEASWQVALRTARLSRGADVVVVQKRLFPGILFRWLSARVGGRIVYDFDDALFVQPRKGGSPTPRLRNIRRLRTALRSAHTVIAGNSFLGDYARQYNPRVAIVPTPVDLAHYPRRPSYLPRNPQVIGWVGTAGNQRYLAPLIGPLGRVAEKHPFLLRVVSDKPFSSTSFPVENIPWSSENEYLALHGMDIGLMPLADDDWCRGKCAFKMIQYMAVGLPVVSSPVGMNCEVVNDGVSGFLVSDEAEWFEKLGLLLADARLREQMGSAGRDIVARNFALNVTLPKLLQVLSGVVSNNPSE